MQRRVYVVAALLVAVILAGSLYYLSQSSPLKNVDLIRSTTATVGAVDLTSSRIEYYPGASGYLVIPNVPGKIPGVIMVHEWWGLNDNIQNMAQQLAKEGYVVLAVDMFNGKVATTPQEAGSQVPKLNSTDAVNNMRAAVKYLKTHEKVNPSKIGSIGWCFGGGQNLRLALSGEQLAATVIYYGTPLETDPQKLSAIKWPVLGIFGDKDQAIPVERVKAFESELKQLGIHVDIYIYPGVGHAFANPSGASYAPKETLDAWQKTVAFLAAALKS